jgi:hypothetical protein
MVYSCKLLDWLAEITLIYSQGRIRCKTLEQLALVLKRAGSASLQLDVSWPMEIEMLELISSQNCLIRSLVLYIQYGTTIPFPISTVRNFNFSQLQKLDIRNTVWDESRELLDLALQSNCTSMTLDVCYGVPILDLFKHELLHQITDIGVWIRQ